MKFYAARNISGHLVVGFAFKIRATWHSFAITSAKHELNIIVPGLTKLIQRWHLQYASVQVGK
jgi:hypothetical protein